MNHEDVWRALDTLAAEHGLSASGLARKAGLDATTFNRSKRRLNDGRARWPSTESIAKVLQATGASLETFTALVGGARAVPHGANARLPPDRAAGQPRRVPLIDLSMASEKAFFDEAGLPTPGSWDEIVVPEITDPHAYAMEISGPAMRPLFRDGDVVIVSPSAPTRRGDRVVGRTRTGEVFVMELARRSALRVELRSLNPGEADRAFDIPELAWLHRIVWISQ